MWTIRRPAGLALLTACTLTVGACAGGLGPLGDILGGMGGASPQGGSGTVVGEVQSVDTRARTIEIVTEQGQRGAVAYDERTVVYYQNQQYEVTALERGDIVALNVQPAGQSYYASTIEVRQSVQERGGSGGVSGRGQAYDGTVGGIDRSRGLFELREQNGRTWVVEMPYSPSREDRYVFERLRSGERVRFEGEVIGNGRIELLRFY